MKGANRRSFLARAAAAGAAPFALLRSVRAETMERKRQEDPETGTEIWQITSFPTVNQNLYFHSRCWTADGKTFLFQSLESPSRSAANELWRANVDGTGFERLLAKRPWGNPALHPKKPLAYFLDANKVFTLDIFTKEIREAGAIPGPGAAGGSPGSFTDDGRLYCFVYTDADGRSGFGRFDTETAKTEIVPLGRTGMFTHLQIEPGKGEIVQFCGHDDAGALSIFCADRAGKIEKLPLPEINGHNAWLGATGMVYANTLGAARDILACRPGDKNFETLAAAPPRYWHTGVSPEGDWMVSDTHSPDDGLYLICVKTGKRERLCRAGSSQGHSQYTHPHPSVAPGARHVVFNSDRTGIPHVYCAEIPEEMKQRLSA